MLTEAYFDTWSQEASLNKVTFTSGVTDAFRLWEKYATFAEAV